MKTKYYTTFVTDLAMLDYDDAEITIEFDYYPPPRQTRNQPVEDAEIDIISIKVEGSYIQDYDAIITVEESAYFENACWDYVKNKRGEHD